MSRKTLSKMEASLSWRRGFSAEEFDGRWATMKVKDWLKIFLLEVLTIPVVIFIFRSFTDRKIAAVIAGTIFVVLGFWILWKAWRSSRWKSFSFWGVLLHLGATSLPLLLTRLIRIDQDFTQVRIFGIPGPVFHYYSERVYLVLLLATLLDLVLAYVSSRRREKDRIT